MDKTVKIIFIVFILLSHLLFSQNSKKSILFYELFRSLVSNVNHQKMVLEQSNIHLANLNISNSYLIEKIKKKTNYFGNDVKKQLEFYDLATKYYFYHLGDKKSKIKAIEMWNELIELDLKNRGKDFQSPYNSQVLEKAFEMQRYVHLINGSPQSDLSGVDPTMMMKTCEQYESHYTNKMIYSKELGLNFVTYFLHREDQEQAEMAYKRLGGVTDDYYQQQLTLLKLSKITDETEAFKMLQHYFLLMKIDKELNQKQSDKDFNHANAILFPPTPPIKLTYQFNKLNEVDKKTRQKAMKMYINVLKQDPNSSEANYNLGLILASEEQVPKAILYLKTALKNNSDFNTLYSLALLEMKLENYFAAYNYLREAELYHSNMASLYNNLSICSKYYKDPNIIHPQFFYINKAIALNQDDHRFYLTKASHLKDEGDRKGYLHHLQLSLRKVKEIKEMRNEPHHEVLEIFSIQTIAQLPMAKEKVIEKINKMIEIEVKKSLK